MTNGKFYTSLSLTTLLLSGLLFYLHMQLKFSPYVNLSIVGVVVFFLLNILMYNIAKYFSQKSDDKKYIGLVYTNLLLKFLIAIGIPVLFYFIYKKPQGLFILPFLIIYITYTVYETWMLNKMAVMRR